jgi:glycosyltransferase involved in cell wall biosynthesis
LNSDNLLPIVSIVTPVYNSEKYIEDTIESVLKQTYPHWEMIIVNDCSTDNTRSIIEKYAKVDMRIHIINNTKNIGAALSRNVALETAKGRYIAFLDSDDVWFPEKLTVQIEFMEQKKLVLTYSSYIVIDQNGNYINRRNTPKKITYASMLKSNHIGNLTGIYDSHFFGKVMFCSDGHEDYILWLNLMKKIGRTEGITQPLAAYRILPNSLSANKLKAIKWQWYIYRKYGHLTFFQSIYYILWYVFYALKKRI